MKRGFNLKKFLTTPDGPEFVLCDICVFNRNGDCIKKGSAADANPTEMYYDICKLFKSPDTPIDAYTFTKLMEKMKEATPCEPGVTYADTMQERRYNMEYLMAVMLEMLGYGEGAKIFLDQGFECPF